MDYIFIFIALFLVLLGLYPFSKRKSLLTVVFMIVNLSLATWNLCHFIQKEGMYFIGVNLVSQLQLESALIFSNGFYFLSYIYPYHSRKINYYAYLAAFLFFTLLIFATDYVSRASLVEGELVFEDGLGFVLYGLYVGGMMIASVRNLYLTYKRNDENKISILLVAFGVALLAMLGILFGVLLPLVGIFSLLDFSTLGTIFPLMFFAYAITKLDFLDISIIINKTAAWLITLLLVVGTFSIAGYLAQDNTQLGYALVILSGIFWAVYAVSLQQFLLTTAKRKFIKGWYDSEEILTQLSEIITLEKNREAIFLTIEKVLDNVLEIEQTNVVVAVRDEDEQLSSYRFTGRGDKSIPRQLPVSHALIENFTPDKVLQYLEECDSHTQEFLSEQGYLNARRCLLIAFHSPEFLEGIVILGERSNQAHYSVQDMRFFRRLVNYMSALLYRLTPMEKLEKQYFENRQKLHEAEIQLIRAQKIESIVHATRQCHHEIRTPLNIIRLGINRVKNLEDLQSYRQLAEEEIAHALEIVDETLTITDVERPSLDRISVINLSEVIRRSLKLVQENKYTVQADLDKEIYVEGIFSDLQVVFANLIHNAFDAMPEGGMIRVQAKVVDEEVLVEFSDSGHGIPESMREKVWEPYYSGHETVVGNSTAGRGWGLTIVNRIISEHKGIINFHSVVDEGTTFTIRLPLASRKVPGEIEKYPEQAEALSGNGLNA